MIKTYIADTLLKELQEAFPNSLPELEDYYDRIITPEQIAFQAGIQHVIRYLKTCSAEQHKTDEGEEIIPLF